jgi:hypothetical protein
MIELDWKPIETIQTPDKETYQVKPLLTRDMKLLLQFTEFNKRQAELKEEGKLDELNKLVYEDMMTVANKLVDKSISHATTGEPLPEQYRAPFTQLIKLCMIIVKETIGDIKGGDNPLELQKKYFGTFEEQSMVLQKGVGVKTKS